MSPTSPTPAPGSGRRRLPRRFQPRAWSILLTLFGCAAFVGLGIWQIDRGHDKARLNAQMLAAAHAAPVDISGARGAQPPATPDVMAAQARGRYMPASQLLLDGQSSGDRVGYDVLTPLRLADGDIVMVNRGWVPGSPDRSHLPQAAVGDQIRDVRGLWRRLPAPGLRLNADNCRAGSWPRVVSYPTHADLKCIYGQPVRPGELLLLPDQPDGYVRDWKLGNGFPPVRHYAYALQWFAFCLVAVFLFFRLNYKPVT